MTQPDPSAAKDLFNIWLATYRLIPKIAPTDADNEEIRGELLSFVADLRHIAKVASNGLGGTPEDQERALDDVQLSMLGIIAGLDAAMLMREPSTSAALH